MSRAIVVLIALFVVLVVGLVWLSRAPSPVAPHRIEQVVTVDGTADAAK